MAQPRLRILQHRRRRLQLGETVGATFERELVAAPLLHVPILVDMRGRPGFVGGERPCASASASSAEPVSVVTDMQRAKPPRIAGMAAPAAASAASG